MNTKVIVKQLAAEEDLLLGEGQITQTRNGQAVTVTKLTLFKIVSSDEELQAIDTSKFKHAMLIENGFGQSYYFNGGSWMPLATTGGQVVSAAPPANPVNGTRWFDTTSGRTYIYYVDVDSAQWVEDNPQNRTIVVGGGGGGAVTSVNGDTGDVTVQEVLVSGTNIKTLNGESLLGAGNIVVSGGGGGATNLTYIASSTQGIVVSDTGTDAAIPAGSATNASLMLPADKTKLDGIQSGAQANAVTSVFTRTGAVVAAAGDYSSAQVLAAASATNYTPTAATVEGHLAGIDTALASSGGGGGGGVMQWKNTGPLIQNSISNTSPGTVIDLGNVNVSLAINTIAGASFTAANDSITLPAGTYLLSVSSGFSRNSGELSASFRLQVTTGTAVSKTFAGNSVSILGTSPDPTSLRYVAHGRYAFTLGATTTFTVNAVAYSANVSLSSYSLDTGGEFDLTIQKVA